MAQALAHAALFALSATLLVAGAFTLHHAMQPHRTRGARIIGLAFAAAEVIGAFTVWGMLR